MFEWSCQIIKIFPKFRVSNALLKWRKKSLQWNKHLLYAKCQLATLVLDKKFQVLSVVQTIVVFLMEKAHFILVIRAAI